VHKQLTKSIWCTIWILSALLVMATLDALPDPPAVNPGSAISLVLHHSFSDFATGRCDAPCAPHPLPVSLVGAYTREPLRPSACLILTAQAADSSPPRNAI
jgi:hypothetical protein